MKLSLPLSLAVLTASTMGLTITRYHTHTHTVVHTHTIVRTHYATLTGDNNQPTTVPVGTDTEVSTGTDEPTTEAPAPTTTTQAQTTTTQAPTTTEAPTTTTSSTSTSSTATPTSTFASEILAEHNKKRALHGVPDLTWSSELEEYAQAYADKYDCNSGSLVHSGGPYGENLALGYDTIPAVDAWYNEISLYNYAEPGFSEATGHFTQLVWKSSTQLGCASKQCGSYYGQYTICSYNPAGNVIGYFEENVLPLVN